MRPLLFFLFLTFCSPIFVAAQDSLEIGRDQDFKDSVSIPLVNYDISTNLDRREFNSESIAEYKREKAFEYLNQLKQDSWWTRFKRWLQMHYQNFISWLFGDYKAHGVIAFLLMVLPYLIIAAIIGLIIWLFIRLNPGPSLLGESPTAEVSYHEEENIVRSQNIAELIEVAIKQGNYRLAVRYYYLQLLRQLNEKGLIDYEFQKTNTEYLKEIQEENMQQSLRKVMRIYDFIWYGSFAVSASDFSLAQNYFSEITIALKRVPNEK